MSEMLQHRFIKELLGALVGLAVISIALNKIATAAEPGESKTKGGLTVYLGVVPAEIVKGPSSHSSDRAMHGRIPRSPDEYLVVPALFVSSSGSLFPDTAVPEICAVTAASENSKKLEPMEI